MVRLVLRRDGQEREIISSSNALSRCSHTIRQRLRAGCSSCVQAVRGAYSKCPSLSRSATLTHDGLTAAASLADMVTDLLVLREFYEKGLTGFFASSLCVLVLAQLSFAFLFTVEHTNSRFRALGNTTVFICVLPFAQFGERRGDRLIKRTTCLVRS